MHLRKSGFFQWNRELGRQFDPEAFVRFSRRMRLPGRSRIAYRDKMMVKNVSLLKDFEKAQLQKQPPDYFRQLRIFEALYREAMRLGVLPLKDPLEGIEVDIHLATVLNVRTTASEN